MQLQVLCRCKSRVYKPISSDGLACSLPLNMSLDLWVHVPLLELLKMCIYYIRPVLYQVLNKQAPVPVPVQVLCINYWHSGTLQWHKVEVAVSFIFKRTVRTNELQTQSVVKHYQSDLLVRLLSMVQATCFIFTALHGIQTRYSDENSICPSVRPSVCLSHACIVRKR